ncbi:FHA domain-containing protein [Magnetospirillum sp. 15-1]|uniref:FHA domain-containing protein n=1 Tax=Magnetospirillum sp. 15-1 TaxID=1979370 RepID=UPI000BBC286A|nr:FHA domain-containing protein [Magnetospirillum sp. 15-1]
MAFPPLGGGDLIRRERLSPDTAILKLRNGPRAGTVFRLDLPRAVLGRSDPPHSTADLDLTGLEPAPGAMISRRHAEIDWADGTLSIRDLGSRNGTFVNRVKLEPPKPGDLGAKALAVGDVIRLGQLEMEVDADRSR